MIFSQEKGAAHSRRPFAIASTLINEGFLPCEKLLSFGLIDEDSFWSMICYADRNTNEIIATNIYGHFLTVKGDYLYFMHNPDGVCRVKLSELVGRGNRNIVLCS